MCIRDSYTPGAADGAEPAARFLSGETDACKVSFSDLPAVEDAGGQVTSFEDTAVSYTHLPPAVTRGELLPKGTFEKVSFGNP